MKKIISILLATSLLLALGGCGLSKEVPEIATLENKTAPSPTAPIPEEDALNAEIYFPPKVVSFAAAGDNIIYTSTWTDARNHASKNGNKAEYDFKPIYEDVKNIIKDADISFINQETLMTGGPNSAYPRFNSPQQLGYDLAELGFDVISIANNHMLDQGNSGLSKTIDFWNTLDVALVGGYKDEADQNNIRVVERDGVKIAFLAYTEHTNEITPQGATPIVPYINDELIKRQTAAARELADIVIVSMHWGEEYTQKPTVEQQRLARLLADSEVDVILGSHSHSLQPIVELTRPSGEKTICIYSLGNFLNAMDRPVNMVGGILTFDIVKPEVGTAKVENVILVPVVCHFGKTWFGSHLYPLDKYTDQLASAHYVDMTVADLKGFVTGAIDAKYLPDYLK